MLVNHNDILILGGSGLLGSNFTKGIKLSSKNVNLLNYEETKKCFKNFNPKIIIHSACKKLSSKLLYNSPANYFNDNVTMSLNIFKAAAETKVEQLIVVSSINALLSGEGELTADTHNHKIKQTLSKVYKQQYNLNSKIIYLTNIYGPHSNEENGFIPFIIKKCYNALISNEDIILTGDKKHKRDFMYVKDANNLIEQFYSHNTPLLSNSFKLYTGITYTLEEIVNIVTELIGFKGKVIWNGKYDNITNKNFIDNDKPINFKFTSLHKGILETIKYYKKDYEGKI